jgi:hypothetical protein
MSNHNCKNSKIIAQHVFNLLIVLILKLKYETHNNIDKKNLTYNSALLAICKINEINAFNNIKYQKNTFLKYFFETDENTKST